MALKFSDKEQTNLIIAVERLYSRASGLRDVAYADNWDRDLTNALDDISAATDDLAEAAEHLA